MEGVPVVWVCKVCEEVRIVSLLIYSVYLHSLIAPYTSPHSIGPEGTAICVYPAYNSRETDSTAMFNRGIFDIFREDLTMGSNERQNTFVEVPLHTNIQQILCINQKWL